MGAPAAAAAPHLFLKSQARWRPVEVAFWLATLLPFVLFPNYLSLASQIAITALFALSIDLVLGYAGIVTLGHAAFFGLGAYGAGIFSKFVWGEPLTGLAAGAAIAAVVGELGAATPREMGKVMGLLKERYAGRMDFGKASGHVKEILSAGKA